MGGTPSTIYYARILFSITVVGTLGLNRPKFISRLFKSGASVFFSILNNTFIFLFKYLHYQHTVL